MSGKPRPDQVAPANIAAKPKPKASKKPVVFQTEHAAVVQAGKHFQVQFPLHITGVQRPVAITLSTPANIEGKLNDASMRLKVANVNFYVNEKTHHAIKYVTIGRSGFDKQHKHSLVSHLSHLKNAHFRSDASVQFTVSGHYQQTLMLTFPYSAREEVIDSLSHLVEGECKAQMKGGFKALTTHMYLESKKPQQSYASETHAKPKAPYIPGAGAGDEEAEVQKGESAASASAANVRQPRRHNTKKVVEAWAVSTKPFKRGLADISSSSSADSSPDKAKVKQQRVQNHASLQRREAVVDPSSPDAYGKLGIPGECQKNVVAYLAAQQEKMRKSAESSNRLGDQHKRNISDGVSTLAKSGDRIVTDEQLERLNIKK